MKVYIAFGSIQYDCEDVLGVYLSKEEALAALQAYKARVETSNEEDYYILNYDSYCVMEKEIGAPCEFARRSLIPMF